MQLRTAPALAIVLAFAASPALAQPECLDGLAVAANVEGTLTLTWPDTQIEGATGYMVLVRPEGGDWLSVDETLPLDRTSWTDIGAASNTTYDYRVLVLVGDGQGPHYCTATATSGDVVRTQSASRPETAEVPFFPSSLALAMAVVCVAGITVYVVKRK